MHLRRHFAIRSLLCLLNLAASAGAQPIVKPDPWPSLNRTTSQSTAPDSNILTFERTDGVKVGMLVADQFLGVNGAAQNGLSIQWDTVVLETTPTTVTLSKPIGSAGVSNGATISFTEAPQQPSTTDEFVGIGCTTAFHIDKDCDGYGVGPGLSGPDADDLDGEVNTPKSAIAKYGTVTAFLSQVKGITPAHIWYIAVDGDDSTCIVDREDRPCRSYAKIDTTATVNKAGVAVVFREGVYSNATLGNSRGGGTPPYGSSAVFGTPVGTGALQAGLEVAAAVPGGASILPLSRLDGLTVGMTVHGPGIAVNTSIIAIDSESSTITIDKPVGAEGLVARSFLVLDFRPFLLMAFPGERVVIDRKSVAVDTKCQNYRADGWTCTAPARNIVIDGFTFQNTGNNGLGRVWESSGAYNMWFVNNDCFGYSAGPYSFINLHRWVIEGNVIRDMNGRLGGSHGIYLGSRKNSKWNLIPGYSGVNDESLDNSNLHLRSNLIYRVGRTCAQHNGGVRRYVVDGNICHSFFGATGLDGEQGVRDSYYRNNVVFGGTRGPFTLYDYPHPGGPNNQGIEPGDQTGNLVEFNTWVVPARSFYTGQRYGDFPNFSISVQSPLNTEDLWTGNVYRNNLFLNFTASPIGIVSTIQGTKTCIGDHLNCGSLQVTLGENGGVPWPAGTKTFSLPRGGGGANAVEIGMTVVAWNDQESFAPPGTYVESLTYDLTSALTITLSQPTTTELPSGGIIQVHGWAQSGVNPLSRVGEMTFSSNIWAGSLPTLWRVRNYQQRYGAALPFPEPQDVAREGWDFTFEQFVGISGLPNWPVSTGVVSGNAIAPPPRLLLKAGETGKEREPGPGSYNFAPNANSTTIGKAIPGSIGIDVRGQPRSAEAPTVGAYEYIPEPAAAQQEGTGHRIKR